MKRITHIQVGEHDLPLVVGGELRLLETGDTLRVGVSLLGCDIHPEAACRLLQNGAATPVTRELEQWVRPDWAAPRPVHVPGSEQQPNSESEGAA